MLESWASIRKIAVLVAEIVGDRKTKISRNKVILRYFESLPTISFPLSTGRHMKKLFALMHVKFTSSLNQINYLYFMLVA